MKKLYKLFSSNLNNKFFLLNALIMSNNDNVNQNNQNEEDRKDEQERKSNGQSSEDDETEQSAPAGGQPMDAAKVLAALNALHAQINNLSQIEKKRGIKKNLDGSSKGSCAAQYRVAPAAEDAPDGVQNANAGQPVDTDTLLAAINAISNTVEERIVIAVRAERTPTPTDSAGGGSVSTISPNTYISHTSPSIVISSNSEHDEDDGSNKSSDKLTSFIVVFFLKNHVLLIHNQIFVTSFFLHTRR